MQRMTEMSHQLLARIAERAADPNRRYMTAAEDQARAALPVDEIEHRFEGWHARNEQRAREAALRDGMTLEEYEKNVQLNKALQAQTGRGPGFHIELMKAQMRAWGQVPPAEMSFVESEGHISASSEPPGAKPLCPPPSEADLATLERILGRRMPEDLKRLYSISDGGFGPGFTGLNPVQGIGTTYEDFRRRGPDYCGTVEYPASFVPIAGELLDYHYDLDTGRIISSDSNWTNHGLDPEDIYDIAFQDLAAMMEDWLDRT
jgi:cell wall assembly regulator SMI1